MCAAGGANVTVSGGSGGDHLEALGGTGVVVLGGSGADMLEASGADAVTLSGGDGDDTLIAGAAQDVYLLGDNGNDMYQFASGAPQAVRIKEILILDTQNFEASAVTASLPEKTHSSDARGTDTLDLTAYSGVAIDLGLFGSEADPLIGQQLVANGFNLTIFGSFEDVVGTDGNDVLIGNAEANHLVGGSGDDRIEGRAGDDTLEGGLGNDTMDGGAGNDLYVFGTGQLGVDMVTEAANLDSDTLDFGSFGGAINVNLGVTASQSFGPNLSLALSDPAGIENVVGTSFSDSITGNARDNIIEGGPGDDVMAGAAGSDTYRFAGAGLGADQIIEAANADSDTLDFSAFDEPLNLDLGSTAPQIFGVGTVDVNAPPAGLDLTLSDPLGIENVVGTGYSDRILGNDRDNAIYGAGGADLLDGRGGNDLLQGDLTQVVLIDFDSATHADSGDHVYTPDERQAIVARLTELFGPFNVTITTDVALAAQLTERSGHSFVSVVMNDGPGGGIGGESNELDFRNLQRQSHISINVNELLGGDGQPEATSENFVKLSDTVIAHELGHLFGLRHSDAFGPIGSGIFAGVDPASYLPAYTGPMNADESPLHIMASPRSIGVTLFDSVGDTFFGEREAIRLAFAATGIVVREQSTDLDSHQSFATAEALGVLPGLYVPNTLAPGSLHYGQSFDVSAIDVVGEIRRGDGPSENDMYSFVGKAGDLMNMEVISRSLEPSRGNPIDSVLRLYDAGGHLLTWNDDEFETTDSTIVDYHLPADGVYYVEVDTYSAALDEDVGRYELFMSRFAVGTPSANLGDTMIGAEGNDTMIGSAADDILRAERSAVGEQDQYLGSGGYDTLDASKFVSFDEAVQYLAGTTQNSIERIIRPDNTAPILTVPSSISTTEGVVVHFTAQANDPGDTVTFAIVSGPSGGSINPSTGEFTWFAPNEGSYTFAIKATDGAGASDTKTVLVNVSNVSPVISIGGDATIPEGGTLTRSGSFTDPGADVWTAEVNYGDGGGWQSLALALDKTFSLRHTFTDDGVFVVGVRVRDDAFAVPATASFNLTVTNVKPTGKLVNAGPVDEGSTATVSFTNLVDPSPNDLSKLRFSFDFDNDGTFEIVDSASPSAIVPAAYLPNGPATRTVRAVVADDDGGASEYFTDIVILNVAPTATIEVLPATTVVEGTPLSFTSTVVDPGTDSIARQWVVVASNGQAVPGGGDPSFAFTPAKNGTYTVLFKATDSDGASSIAIVEITVLKGPPIGVLTNDGPVNEGQSAIVTLTPTDVTLVEAAQLRYAFDLDNDGTFEVGDGTYSGSVSTNAATVPATLLADGPSSRMVRARVIDPDDRFNDYTTTIQIKNVAPTVLAGGAASLSEASPMLSRDGSFSDPGADTWTAEVNYGDGGGWQSLTLNADHSFHLEHSYGDSGNYPVSVRVTDDEGAIGDASFVATVANVAPTATLTNGGAVGEGSPGLVSFNNLFDPSSADLATLRFAYDFDNNGTFEVGDGSYVGSVTSTSEVVPASYLMDNPGRTVHARVIDKDGGSTDYTTTIVVNNLNPTAANDFATTDEEVAVEINVLANDSDPAGVNDPLTINSYTDPSHGTLSLADDKFTYMPGPNFNGSDSFTYTIDDGDGGTATATVLITVNPINDAPTDIGLTPNSVAENQPALTLVGQFSTSDVDAGDVFTYKLVSGDGDADNGAFIIVGSELRTATVLNREIKASLSIRVQVTDSGGLTFEKSIPIDVVDAGEATPQSGTTGGVGWIYTPASDTLTVTGRPVADNIQIGTAVVTNGIVIVLTTNNGASITFDGLAGRPAIYAQPLNHLKRIIVNAQGGADTVILGTPGTPLPTSAYDAGELNGDGGNDTLFGGQSPDTLHGDVGDDKVDGRGGSDSYTVAAAEALQDVITDTGATGIDTFKNIGTAHVDVRNFAPSNGIEVVDMAGYAIRGDGSNNVLDFRSVELKNLVYVDGAKGDDLIYTSALPISYALFEGYFGDDGNDTIQGGPADDKLFGEKGNDLLAGGIGNDRLDGGVGNDTLDGGVGNDVLGGGAGNDNLSGGDGPDLLDGADGDDTLVGGNDNDTLIGGNDNDTQDGNDGSDRYEVAGTDALLDAFADSGATGVDTMINVGASHVDVRNFYSTNGIEIVDMAGYAIRGDNKDNTLDFRNAELKKLVYVDGANGDDLIYTSSLPVTYAQFEGYFGDDGNDTIQGGSSDDKLYGEKGDDSLLGGSGNDTLGGGDGTDILDGQAGSDTYAAIGDEALLDVIADTGPATDTDTLKNVGAPYFGAPTADLELSNFTPANKIEVVDTGGFAILGDHHDNVLDFSAARLVNVKFVSGAKGSDLIRASNVPVSNSDFAGYFGDDGDDTLTGGNAPVMLFGEKGNDSLIGGVGNDTLVGGAGKDTLNGGLGNDVFYLGDISGPVVNDDVNHNGIDDDEEGLVTPGFVG